MKSGDELTHNKHLQLDQRTIERQSGRDRAQRSSYPLASKHERERGREKEERERDQREVRKEDQAPKLLGPKLQICLIDFNDGLSLYGEAEQADETANDFALTKRCEMQSKREQINERKTIEMNEGTNQPSPRLASSSSPTRIG